MLASSANIPDNIKWINTTANTWALRAVSLITETHKPKLQPFLRLLHEDIILKPSDEWPFLCVFRPIFGLPFLVTKNLNKPKKRKIVHAKKKIYKCVPNWRENIFFFFFPPPLSTLGCLKSSSIRNHLHSMFGKLVKIFSNPARKKNR